MADWDPGEWSCHVKVHGILMLLGWGFFIPVAIFTNSHLYRRNFRHQRFGMHFHMALITVGLVLSLAGFGYGMKHLATFTRNRDHVSSYQMTHAVLGTIAAGLAIVEVLLVALMRTVKSEDDRYETWPMWRKVGHTGHRSLGFVAFTFAAVSLETGSLISSVHQDGYEHLAKQNSCWEISLSWLESILLKILSMTSFV